MLSSSDAAPGDAATVGSAVSTLVTVATSAATAGTTVTTGHVGVDLVTAAALDGSTSLQLADAPSELSGSAAAAGGAGKQGNSVRENSVRETA